MRRGFFMRCIFYCLSCLILGAVCMQGALRAVESDTRDPLMGIFSESRALLHESSEAALISYDAGPQVLPDWNHGLSGCFLAGPYETLSELTQKCGAQELSNNLSLR